ALSRLASWRNVQMSLELDEQGNRTTQPDLAVDTAGQIAASLPARRSAEFAPAGVTTAPRANDVRVPGLERLIPQKRHQNRDILSLPLTRPQRLVYFLVDGKRTLADISRCTGKNIQELDQILSELQAQGLILI
ncbi:MAG TPA: hypothetical protein VGT44_00730, partial [Ktedonobacteraceae bacterium]|nr:hypothetical protein [Ktedonobacteraceae bacterium]